MKSHAKRFIVVLKLKWKITNATGNLCQRKTSTNHAYEKKYLKTFVLVKIGSKNQRNIAQVEIMKPDSCFEESKSPALSLSSKKKHSECLCGLYWKESPLPFWVCVFLYYKLNEMKLKLN